MDPFHTVPDTKRSPTDKMAKYEIKTILTNVKKDPITGRYTYDEKIKTIQPLMPSPMTVKVYRLPNE